MKGGGVFTTRLHRAIFSRDPCMLPSVVMSRSFTIASRVSMSVVPLLLAFSASADTSKYSFTIESEGAYAAVRRGQLLVSNDRWRIDLDAEEEVRAHDSVLGSLGEGRRIALNHANRTWYYLDADMPSVALPSLLDFYRRNPTTITKFQIEGQRSRKGGVTTTSFRFDTQSKIGPESLRGEVAGEIEVVSSEPGHATAPVIRALRPLMTGNSDLDAKLQDVLTRASAATGESTVTMTRRFQGASPMKQVIRIRVERAGEPAMPEDRFAVPGGYEHQPPVIGFPGARNFQHP